MNVPCSCTVTNTDFPILDSTPQCRQESSRSQRIIFSLPYIKYPALKRVKEIEIEIKENRPNIPRRNFAFLSS